MNFDYDVVIVGAGPIGSNLAYLLSKNNLSICLIDKKKEIGIPLQCAGIVSKDILNYIDIPNDLIINKAKGAFLHTKNNILQVNKEESTALIIDRVLFDKYLFKKAIGEGVEFIQNKVINIDSEKGIVKCANGDTISSKIIVGADGVNSIVSKEINNDLNKVNASQFLVKIDDNGVNDFRNSKKNINEFVDVYVDSRIFPGFLWCIPTENNLYRVGLFSDEDYKSQNLILNEFLEENFTVNSYEIIEKYKGAIPKCNFKNKLYENRVLLIGDAAAQVKPTTGGGLVLGFNISKYASKIITNSIINDDISLIKNYADEFKNKFFNELTSQYKLQKTLKILSNDDLDYLFKKLKENDAEELISKYGDIDKQSILIKEFFKRGLIFKVIPSLFIKNISSIWNYKFK
ncbi:NAD(P)/FAD-dependent oxidoreductase [Methanobrevibacter sp. OttesenSCG-928-I08]|nr:NAD(P)/FAD-dependent oxidoreductase [Methanobrevibacter sp. OttesenSCG-928-I08]